MKNVALSDKQKFYVELILTTIVLTFVLVFTFFIFNKIFIKQEPTYLTNTISAFLGAFIAFIFIRFAEFLDKIFKRMAKHRDALLSLQKLGNEYLNTIGDNIFVIDDFTKIAKKRLGQTPPFIYFNELHEFIYDKQLIKGLTNLEIANDLFSFEASVEKMNSSIRATNRFYLVIRDALVSGSITSESYSQNVNNLLGKLNELKGFLKDLEDEDLVLMTKVRILIDEEQTFYTRVLNRVAKKELTQKQIDRMPKERKKLEMEIEETKKISRSRIDKVLKNQKGKKND